MNSDITQEDIDNVKAIERIHEIMNTAIEEMKKIDADFAEMGIKIAVAGSAKMELHSACNRICNRLQKLLDNWEKHDIVAQKKRIVGPDFKYHTEAEINAMTGRQ